MWIFRSALKTSFDEVRSRMTWIAAQPGEAETALWRLAISEQSYCRDIAVPAIGAQAIILGILYETVLVFH